VRCYNNDPSAPGQMNSPLIGFSQPSLERINEEHSAR
jgi:hypothetical protein